MKENQDGHNFDNVCGKGIPQCKNQHFSHFLLWYLLGIMIKIEKNNVNILKIQMFVKTKKIVVHYKKS